MAIRDFTAAQRRVILALMAGQTYQAIASSYGLSVETVRNHVRQACERIPIDFAPNLGARTRLLMWYAATQHAA